jgi:tellurite resistance protein
MRMQRWLESDRNPLMQPLQGLAEEVRKQRRPAADDNPFRIMERAGAGLVTQFWDNARDMQNAMIEWNFHLLWGAPPVQAMGEQLSRTVSEAPREDLRTLTSVQDALDRIELGDFADGVIRMLIFLAQSRKEVRRSRLERSNRMLMATEPFASMKPKHRTRMIHKESLIVGYEPEAALAALPKLIVSIEDRRRAMALCEEIAGSRDEMSPETLAMLDRLARALELKPLPVSVETPDLVERIPAEPPLELEPSPVVVETKSVRKIA